MRNGIILAFQVLRKFRDSAPLTHQTILMGERQTKQGKVRTFTACMLALWLLEKVEITKERCQNSDKKFKEQQLECNATH